MTPAAVPLVTELPGRVEAARTAQVRARVNGIVLRRLFREGTDVRAGQPLFQIDAAPYEAALASARAQLARAEAQRMQAEALLERYRPLRDANAISQQEFVNADAAAAQARADVGVAQAAIRTAQLNVDYATVRAPIDGRIGRALVSEGALVSATEATQLAVVQQTDPVTVNITQPATELRRLREQVAAGRARAADAVPVSVLLEDGSPHPAQGRLLFSDVSVDATSGQVLLRAEVPNPGLALLPGQYVRVRLAQARVEQAVAVPQQAVTRGPQGDSVIVVGPENKPVPRPVRIGGASDGRWLVTEGLAAGDRVIVDGVQKMRPGSPVTPVPWSPGGASAPAAAGRAAGSAAAPAASAASR